MRLGRVSAALAVALSLASFGVARANPEIGSPLLGGFCSSGGAITGTGASFAKNANQQVFIPAYQAACSKGSVTYNSTGSGAGKTGILNRTVAWGGSDEPLGPDEWSIDSADAAGLQGRVSPIHHIPLAVGAVTISYNLASCGIGQEQLNFRSPVASAIFAGVVTSWSDPLLVADNPALSACNKSIKLAVRSDVSGTTYAFKDYLSKRNPFWRAYMKDVDFSAAGGPKQIQNTAWPAQDAFGAQLLRGNGNGGVAAAVKNNDGAIGYVELSTAKANGLTWGKVDGPHLQFMRPDTGRSANCDEAATGAAFPPSTLSSGWDLASITDSANPTAYPICTITFALVYNNLKSAYGGGFSAAQAQTLADYLGTALSAPVQASLANFGYAPLSTALVTIARAGVASLNYN
jgi:phosphate transport system substrate-binding protein